MILVISSERDSHAMTVLAGLSRVGARATLLDLSNFPERMQLAVEAGAKRILIPSENKRDVAEVPDSILTKIQWQFYDSPTRAVIMDRGKIVFSGDSKGQAIRDAYASYIRAGIAR